MSLRAYQSDDFEIDLLRGELSRQGNPCRVEPQVFHLLVHLIANRDRIVSIDELLDVVWNGRIVSDATVLSRISAARAAIGDSGARQELIRTIRKSGFRFVGPIEPIQEDRKRQTPVPNPDSGTAPLSHRLDDLPAKSTEFMHGVSLAVFSFETGPGGVDQQFLAAGLAAEIATDLARNKALFVIAPAATAGLFEWHDDMQALARRLGVRYVLKGYVANINRRVRLNLQLHDAIDRRLVWAERFQGDLRDVFHFLNSTVAQIVQRLSVELPRIERQRALRLPEDRLQAYEFVLRGDYHHDRMTRATNQRAISMYQKAVSLDPTFAPAFAGLAWAQNHQGNQGWSKDRDTAVEQAHKSARMALGLNCELAKAHSVMGDVQLWRHQHKKSVNSGSQAVECDPSHADSRMVYAYCLAMNGDGNGALRQAKLALRHNPLRANRIYYSALGHACFLTRDYEGARKASIEGIRRDSNHHGLRLLLAASLTRLGELEAAQKEISAALGIEPDLRRGNLGRLWPYRSGDDLDRFVEALADCGLPA